MSWYCTDKQPEARAPPAARKPGFASRPGVVPPAWASATRSACGEVVAKSQSPLIAQEGSIGIGMPGKVRLEQLASPSFQWRTRT